MLLKMKSRKKRILDAQYPEQHVHIPTELLVEILGRLPVKSLLKFRCVSKTWCSFIDSQDFILIHLKLSNNNRNNTYLLLMEKIKRRKGYECIFTIRSAVPFRITDNLCKLSGSWKLVGSCNGLVLLEQYPRKLRLWNPCIRSSVVLPSVPFSDVYIANYLLGYSSCRDDYRVVALKYRQWSVSIAVYSLQNHSWSSEIKRIEVPFSSFDGTPFVGYRVFIQGVWFGIGKGETHLVSFDIESEDFSFVELPDAGERNIRRFIFVLGDSLAIFSMSSIRFCIWVLEKDAKREPWRLWFSTDSNVRARRMLLPLSFRYSRIFYDQDSATFIIQLLSKLVSYKITTHRLRVLRYSTRGQITLDDYVQSLVLHKGTEGLTLTSFP